MTVAIIIPTFGHFDYAALAIESASRTPGSMLIVVDDASTAWPGERIVSGWVESTTPYVLQRYSENAGLSRSWNAGLRLARAYGCEFAVCGNSDLVFPRGWWHSIEVALRVHHFAGPVTNAPGHVRDQNVGRYLPAYEVDDDPDDIDVTQSYCDRLDAQSVVRSNLNGFCITGRTESFFRVADPHPFSPSIPLAGNEDDFFRRAEPLGLSSVVVPQSFVFHYRSVSRGLVGKSIENGAVRLSGCGGCVTKA